MQQNNPYSPLGQGFADPGKISETIPGHGLI